MRDRRDLRGQTKVQTVSPLARNRQFESCSLGSGEARIGDARVPVRPGDWIALPTGPELAHQMVNVSTAEPLVYLCISTMRGAEIVEYPDSRKVGAGVADPTSPVGFRRIGMFRAGSGTLDYWESEPEAG
jgi:hypothetical protein